MDPAYAKGAGGADDGAGIDGTEGNERLTVITGHVLIVLLAVLGATIVAIGRLMWLHLFLGLALIGPVMLKLASTGYRFVRYYSADPRFRAKGPPAPALRVLGPVLATLTVAVFATGVALLLTGPQSSMRPVLGLLHKASFICWLVATAIHVTGHVPELLRFRAVPARTREELGELRALVPGFGQGTEPPAASIPGGSARWLSLAGALAVGLVLAVSLLGHFGAWTSGQRHRDRPVAAAALTLGHTPQPR
ncbi:MAG: hypothetical protein ACRDL5_12615 [Solirubrobacteraceae bacterium]